MSVPCTLLASVVIAAGGVATLASSTDGFQAFTSETARQIDVRDHPRVLPQVPLQTADGQTTDFAALRGHWLLVEFIYTRCMSYCAMQGAEFAGLQRRLAKPIANGKVTLLSITFDPSHDDAAQLAAYKRRSGDLGAGWLAARPTSAAGLRELKQAFGVTAIPDGHGGYVHNAAIAVVDPRGRLVSIVDWDAPDEAVRLVMQGREP